MTQTHTNQPFATATRRSFSRAMLGCAVSALLAAGATGATGATGAIAAEAYPSQPVRLVVPFPPAGGTDVLSRLVFNKIGQATKWKVVVENRAGAGGNIGLDSVAKAKPDGYTLGMGQTANLAINPTLYPKMPYNAQKDFTPVVLVAAQPVVLIVRSDAPYKNVADLVAAGKAKPLSMASAGAGTVGHLTGEMFARRAGIKMLHVPYKGASPALTDLMGGQTDFYFATPPIAMPMVKAGKVRAIAVTSAKRLPLLSAVPTVAESGYAGFQAEDWKALVAPAGTPAEVVARLNAEVNKVLAQPDTIAKLHEEGSEPRGGSAKDLTTFIQSENTRWSEIVRQSGARVE
ncbi:Bug family tripartite tricarboxylate transporter substrate binding protein [Cupriavidus consociatus]|uniref:Bug family tripartite tricarboxylate transporter substrate binding protein n=1 Tax=Cupriavidus consociatus TaxID=2821357 RepID=UPI001AE63809|nr:MULTISPECIES: tripartite tricarboxylate transporter substrate binding protein [unclassified Cupriavidus]MBP0625019.1 tripartite tricarboxylate transporter substrate binding protein [Cupriavidus sp. LEh25]MDK2661754.1 tripartite tricarboxylate transporter substrate binding protein [Cupriavidus sp. LEh21]